ncbi:MAG: hypothetical protein JSU68_01020 [Phycisphaerales bacterium]|nr:MAG: hypothetical protein JSU68_01020 [Phycisphaerales bacterium]
MCGDRSAIGVIICCAMPVAIALPSVAATYTVSDFGDDGSPGQLRTLVAGAADTDVINIPAGTIVLQTGRISILASITIQGAGATNTIIDGDDADRVFRTALGTTVTIANVTIRNGFTPFNGGGVESGGTMTLVNCVVTGCEARGVGVYGGGVFSTGPLTLTHCRIEGNEAVDGHGGGVSAEGPLTVEACTIRDNEASIDVGGVVTSGGGVFASGGGTVTDSTITDNESDWGGGIFIHATPLTLTNVTVSGSRSRDNGGGIADNNIGSVLECVTIMGNAADVDGDGLGTGGGLYVVFAPINVRNTVIAGNTDSASHAPDCWGTVESGGHNLIQNTDNCTINGVTDGNIYGVEARLGPLQDNGGRTHTHAPLADSPVIDAGDSAACPMEDQRGVARPVDYDGDGVADCDIGAVEAIIDCNGNMVHDAGDLAGGTSTDCDGNGVPDECQPDSDGDGTIDACEGPCGCGATTAVLASLWVLAAVRLTRRRKGR